jgi:hypothetical protein
VAANIYVYFPSDPDGPNREDIAEELEGFFGGTAEDCGAGTGITGFNLDYELVTGQDPHAWADRLKTFLAGAGVRPGTKFDVFPDGWEPGMEWRRVEVFGEDRRRTDRPGPARHA